MLNNRSEEILIIGAGVSGLSTGILLAINKYKPIIWAKDLPPNTTSNKAAAVWYPFHAEPVEKVAKWAGETLEYFLTNIVNDRDSGAFIKTVIEIFPKEESDPLWKEYIKSFRRTQRLPNGYKDGYAVDGVVMITDIYMQYLLDRFNKLGGTIEKRFVSSLDEALESYNIVINCTGLGAQQLVNDSKMFPCRGQIVSIPHNGFPYTVFEEKGPNSLAYIIPRRKDIILGGTLGKKDDFSLETRLDEVNGILARCASLYPEFKGVKPTSYKVGLRPARDGGIRLEKELFNDGLVIHNYGHGGSGFTLSWGCAKEVIKILKQYIN